MQVKTRTVHSSNFIFNFILTKTIYTSAKLGFADNQRSR